MGITVIGHELAKLDNDSFHKLDYHVMAMCFELHNELGRLHDEKIYQERLLEMLTNRGFGAAKEVRIKVEFDSFSKSYAMDLLVNGSIIYELKAAESISGGHRAQAINYLHLTGLKCGKIINFRPASVESKFITTRIGQSSRYDYSIDDSGMTFTDEQSRWLREMIGILLREWGTFLSIELYSEAIVHFAGGPDRVMKPVPIESPARVIGHESFNLLNESSCLEITSVKKTKGFGRHLQKKLNHTRLDTLHWININGHDVTLCTLKNNL